MHDDAWTLPPLTLQSPQMASRCSSVCLISESGAVALVKKHCIPFHSAPLQIRGGSEPSRPTGAHFTGNEVLRGAAASLCGRLAQLRLRLLLDPDGAQGGAARLG